MIPHVRDGHREGGNAVNALLILFLRWHWYEGKSSRLLNAPPPPRQGSNPILEIGRQRSHLYHSHTNCPQQRLCQASQADPGGISQRVLSTSRFNDLTSNNNQRPTDRPPSNGTLISSYNVHRHSPSPDLAMAVCAPHSGFFSRSWGDFK